MDTAQATLAVLTTTLFVLGLYTFFTWRQAKAAERTAESSVRSVQLQTEATLTPCLEQYIEETWRDDGVPSPSVRINYKNVGSGPAVRIAWQIENGDGQRLPRIQWRNGMPPDAVEGWVKFQIDRSDFERGVTVVAEYESVFGIIWRSTLPLSAERVAERLVAYETQHGEFYRLQNDAGDIKIERIGKRTIGQS